jgi:hypothetical protein
MKNSGLVSLCKKSRHFYLSSQYVHDLQPQTIKQLDNFLCFRAFSGDKLDHIHNLSIDLDKFIEIYDHVMREAKFDFLFIIIM